MRFAVFSLGVVIATPVLFTGWEWTKEKQWVSFMLAIQFCRVFNVQAWKADVMSEKKVKGNKI